MCLLDLLLLVSIVWTPVYWIVDPFGWFPDWKYSLFLLPVLIAVLRGMVRALRRRHASDGLWETDAFKKLCLALTMPFLMFLGIEFFLAKIGFSAPLRPIALKGETSLIENAKTSFIADESLIWAFNPGVEFNGRTINQMGFADREVDPEKAPGSMRVICMGDSCSGQGIPPYSGFLNTMLLETPPTPAPWESFNMAVHGYSSAQGLRLFDLRVSKLQPDYVSIYFGWNDHWEAEQPDRMRMATEVRSGLRWYLVRKLQNKLFYQCFVSVLNRPEGEADSDSGEYVLRVPPDDYRRNLEQLVSGIRQAGARPILMTAPRNRTLTAALVHNRQTPSVEDAIVRHDEYNDICRSVAREHKALFIDLATMFEKDEFRQWFSSDGIHFQEQGRILIASALYELICNDAAQP